MLMPRHENLMPKLPDPDLERFAQRLAAHVPVIDAFRAVVPDHRGRGRAGPTCMRGCSSCGRFAGTPISEVPEGFEPDKYCTREWILWTALDNIEKCAGRKPVRKVMWKNGKRVEYEEFVFDPHAVNRGLEIIGREVGLFAETYELQGMRDFPELAMRNSTLSFAQSWTASSLLKERAGLARAILEEEKRHSNDNRSRRIGEALEWQAHQNFLRLSPLGMVDL
jgi:hypothetical protein